LEKGVRYFEQAVEKDPDFALAHATLAEAWRYLQFFGGARPQDARAKAKNAALKAVALDVGLAEAHAALASGMKSVDQWILDRKKKAAGRGYVSAYQWATQYAALGEKEHAFEWLEKAYADREPMMALLNTDPAYDSLRSEPRFGDLLRRIRVAAQAVNPLN
jgi:hypothetical protein